MSLNQPLRSLIHQIGPLLGRNLLAAIVLLLLLLGITKINKAYDWTWNTYVVKNLRDMTSLPYAPLEQRLTMKLGEDYQYLLFLRNSTPTNAVIYYPSNSDFTTTLPGQVRSPFSGKLNDKLTAIRVLYPRRVITADEYNQTPWSQKITHVAIVNGQNLDKLPYRTPAEALTTVLPMDSTQLSF